MYAPPITLTEPYSANYLSHDQAKANNDALEVVLTQARAANIFSERANRADGPLFDAKPAISLVDSQGAAITSTLVDVPLTIVGSGFLLHPHVTIHLDTANGQILGTANPDGGDFRQVFQGLRSTQAGDHTLVVTDGSVVVTQLTVTFNSLRLDPTRVSNIPPSCLLCPVH